ncbi:VgrG-related protein [Intrasporangium sp.]|uniref:VgrG-related protein n=1 Tax=Intrasporangium sp. TaxID=1925024 RepID=UPI003221FD19
MPNEETSSTAQVAVNGQPLPPEVAAALVSVVVEDSRQVPALFVLTFLDEDADVLQRAALRIGAQVRVQVQRSGPGSAVELLTGEVTALEVEVSELGTRTVVRGYDKTHRLQRGRRVKAYTDMTVPDIVRSVASAAALSVGQIDSFPGVLKHVSQAGVSDWAFLQELATSVGAEVALNGDGALDFRKPARAATGPATTASARQNALVVEKGYNLIHLRGGVTASDQVPSVEVRGWDVAAAQAIVSTQPAAATNVDGNGIDPAGLARAFGAQPWLEPWPAHTTSGPCGDLAASISARLAAGCVELDGIVRGNPSLRAGAVVAVTKVGTPFDGKYVLTSTRHEISRDRGYVTHFAVSGASERSLHGIAESTGAGPARRRRVDGLLNAVVTSVKDPDNKGRVQVKYPVLSDSYVSAWARTVQPGAGGGRGAIVLPEVNDEVLVGFGLGNFNDPYVLGGLYNGRAAPTKAWGEHVDSTSGAVTRRAFVSRTGMVVELVETQQDEQLTLSTSGGKQRVTLTQKANAGIEIVSEGPVSVTAKQDVTVTAQQGVSVTAQRDVKVETTGGNLTAKALEITLEGSTAVKVKAPNVAVEATGSLELKGTSVKIAANATAELSAAALTTVKGGLVRIN